MARRTARAENNPRNLLRRHSRNDRRLDLLADEDDLTGADLRLLDPQNILCNAFAYIAQIDRTCSEVLILHLFKELCLLICRIEDALRGTACCGNLGGNVLCHHGILHHHAVRLEDGSLLCLLLFAQTVDG